MIENTPTPSSEPSSNIANTERYYLCDFCKWHMKNIANMFTENCCIRCANGIAAADEDLLRENSKKSKFELSSPTDSFTCHKCCGDYYRPYMFNEILCMDCYGKEVERQKANVEILRENSKKSDAKDLVTSFETYLDPKIATKSDPVCHPSHYTSHPTGIECIDVIEWMPCNIANAMKYFWRCGLKEGNEPIQELRKAAWYIECEIARLQDCKR